MTVATHMHAIPKLKNGDLMYDIFCEIELSVVNDNFSLPLTMTFGSFAAAWAA